jgi:hypothetical protein
MYVVKSVLIATLFHAQRTLFGVVSAREAYVASNEE